MAILDKIGKYKIIDKIGTGAMGVVYTGFDPKMGRYVAVKTMSPQYVNNDESRARFYKEAIAPAKLFHPNLVAIYDLDEEEGTPFIVMEFLDGLDLKYFRSAKIRFNIPQVLNILIQMSEGLDFAHKRGIVHRDVKPANMILLKNGVLKIVDFGIARLSESTQQTRTGVAMGTPAYMSPEQAKGMRVDHRTDLYSVGVIAYEMITGQNPFHAENYTGVLYKIINFTPPPVHEEEPKCPRELSEAILRCLEKERDNRHADLKVFSKICQQILQGFGPEASRLEISFQSLDSMDTTALQEPYKVRLIRKYIKEFQFEAASKLLEKLKDENVDETLIKSLHSELTLQHTKKRVNDLLKLGMDLVENEEFEMALTHFNEILELAPDNVEAITWAQKAIRLRKEKLFKTNVQPLMEEAARKRAAGGFAEAVELYRRVLAADPEYVEVRRHIEECERELARLSKVRQLVAELQATTRASNYPAAFGHLEELRQIAPESEESRLSQDYLWKGFRAAFQNQVTLSHTPEELLNLRNWLREIFAHRSVVGFFSAPAHLEEKNEFLQFIRRLVSDWIQQNYLDSAQMLLEAIMPVFPRQTILQTLSTEVGNLQRASQESRRRQLVLEQKLEEGLRQIQLLLAQDHPEEAQKLFQDLARIFPGEKSLFGLRDEIQEGIRRQESERQLQLQLEQIRFQLQEDNTDKAGALLSALETVHARRPEVTALRASLDEKNRLAAQREEIRGLQERIQGLQDTGHVDQALDLARKACQRFPEEPRFLSAIRILQELKETLLRREEIRTRSREIMDLGDMHQYAKAGKLVQELKNQFAQETEVLEVLKGFHEKRFAYVQSSLNSAQVFSSNKAFEEARAILEGASAECSDSLDLQNALQELRVNETIQKVMAEVRNHLAEKKYDLALATLEGLLARYPEKPHIGQFHAEILQQRNSYIQESMQNARALARESDFDRALGLLRTAADIVPNSVEIQDLIAEVSQLRESYFRQRKEAAEGARLMEAEVERAIAEARKNQTRGNLFDALRSLEDARHRFPQAVQRLDPIIQEFQGLIDVQMHIQPTVIPAVAGKRWVIPVMAIAAVLVLGLALVLWLVLKPGPVTVPPPPQPAVLAVDLRPWGEVVRLTRLDTGKEVALESRATPLQVEIPPGRYEIVYRLGNSSANHTKEQIALEPNSYQVFKKVSPGLEKEVDQVLNELLPDNP